MKAVVFDFYGTLAEATNDGPTWEEVFAEHGYELSQPALNRLWNAGVDGLEHDEHSHSRDHYVAWQQSRLREVLEESGVPDGDDDLLFSRIMEFFGHERLHAYDDSCDVLTTLRSRGFATAICSNWDWDLHEAIAAVGLTGTADHVVSSAWVGARKPHPRIYRHTLDLLAIDPADALFVGDTWSCDVDGPEAMGMRSYYIRRPHFGPEAGAPEDTAAHLDLGQLLDLVGESPS